MKSEFYCNPVHLYCMWLWGPDICKSQSPCEYKLLRAAEENKEVVAATDSQHPQTEICPHWVSGELCIWEGFRGVRQGCDFIAPCKLSVVR